MVPHNMPLVSVIIPCYNAERWLQATLDSVTAQTWPALEVILVDDGSSDGTAAIIRQFEAVSRLPVKAVFGPNRGPASARKTGLAQASGEYIQFLEADDLLLPEAIALKVAALQDIGGGVAYSDWQKLEEKPDGQFQPGACVTRTIEQVDPDPEIALFSHFWAPPVALLYSRHIVDSIGGWKQHLVYVEDARFMLDALFCGASYVHVPVNLARYRIAHAPSHSRQAPLKFFNAVLSNAQEVETIWRTAGKLDDRHKRALIGCYDYVSRELFIRSPSLFDDALAHIQALQPGFAPTWPRIAGLLKRILGLTLAARILSLLGKSPGA
jgi:glycosyltransferase involved in cell wall biosynthesis